MVCGPQGGHCTHVYFSVVFALAAPCKDACVLPEGALGSWGVGLKLTSLWSFAGRGLPRWWDVPTGVGTPPSVL